MSKEKPKFETMQTHDLAVAQAIAKLTSKDVIELLANIDRRDIPRLALLLSIADDFKLSWLKTYIISELALTCSIEGRRAEQIVTVSRQPDIVPETGILDRMRGKVRR